MSLFGISALISSSTFSEVLVLSFSSKNNNKCMSSYWRAMVRQNKGDLGGGQFLS